MFFVMRNNTVRIEECKLGFSKGNAMLLEIGKIFFFIPLKRVVVA